MAKTGKTIFGTITNVLRGLLMAVSFPAIGWCVTALAHSLGMEFDNPALRIITALIWVILAMTVTLATRQSIKESFRLSFERQNKVTVSQKIISFPLAFLFGVSLNRIITMLVSVLSLPSKIVDAEKASTADAASSENIWLVILAVWIVAPIVEELIYRGKAYWYFEKSIGRIPAIIITSLIFAVCHGNVLQGAYAFIAALFCCMFTRIMGTSLTGVFTHIGFNASNFILALTLTSTNEKIRTGVDVIVAVVFVLTFVGLILTSKLNAAEPEKTEEPSIYIEEENK